MCTSPRPKGSRRDNICSSCVAAAVGSNETKSCSSPFAVAAGAGAGSDGVINSVHNEKREAGRSLGRNGHPPTLSHTDDTMVCVKRLTYLAVTTWSGGDMHDVTAGGGVTHGCREHRPPNTTAILRR